MSGTSAPRQSCREFPDSTSSTRQTCRQHGLFTLTQALQSGYTRPAVRRRIADGTWDEVDTRVYLVATGLRVAARELLMARTLATGGVAAGLSAAALYGLVPFPNNPQVTALRSTRTKTHRDVRFTISLPPSDIALVDGIPATRPTRTVIDLASLMPRENYEDLFDTAIVTRVVTTDRLERRARELWAPRRASCALVLALLAVRHPELARARNSMEAKLLRVLDAVGAPRPRVNHHVRLRGEHRIIDYAWPELKLGLEFDGFVPHSTRRTFDDDRVRRNLFTSEHWQLYYATKTGIARNARQALAPLLEALAAQTRAISHA